MNLLTSLSSTCSDYSLAVALNVIHTVINMMQIAAPILLIVSLLVSFARNLFNPEDKKSNKRILNAILAALICFFIPTIVSIVLSLIPNNFAGLDMASCWQNANDVHYDEEGKITTNGGEKTKLGIDFTSLRKAHRRPSDNDTPNASGLTPCGGKNLADVAVQCVEGTGKQVEIANYALSFEGYPYVYGGKGENLTTETYNRLQATYGGLSFTEEQKRKYLDKGYLAWDCSGFVSYVYKHFGYQIASYTGDLVNAGKQVGSLSEAQPGDLLVQHSGGTGHVALYVGGNKIVHAQSTATGTVVSDASSMNYSTIRRIVS